MKRTLLLLLFVILTSCSSNENKELNQKVKIDIKDSVSVIKYISTSTICDKLNYIIENPSFFASGEGYSDLMFLAVTKELNTEFELQLSNGGVLIDKKTREDTIVSLIKRFKKVQNCK